MSKLITLPQLYSGTEKQKEYTDKLIIATTEAILELEASLENTITGLSSSGTTITYTKADGTKGTIETQDTNTIYTSITIDEIDEICGATLVSSSEVMF